MKDGRGDEQSHKQSDEIPADGVADPVRSIIHATEHGWNRKEEDQIASEQSVGTRGSNGSLGTIAGGKGGIGNVVSDGNGPLSNRLLSGPRSAEYVLQYF